MNVQMGVHIPRIFIVHLLVQMHQKKKIALEIADFAIFEIAIFAPILGRFSSSDGCEGVDEL